MTRLALVTGASGFIGPSLCAQLVSSGWRIRALMRRPATGPWSDAVRLNLGVEPIPSSLLSGVDCVFHLAGKAHALGDVGDTDEAYRSANLQSTLDLLEAARAQSVRGFVYFSSVKAMASPVGTVPGEAAPAEPDSPYGRSKLAAEQAVLGSGAVPHPVVLRPALVYGPGPKGYLEQMIRAIRAGWFPPLPETGNARSMVHRDDLAEAARLCAEDPVAGGRTYVVTDGIPYSTRELYELIVKTVGRRVPHWTVPIGLLRLAALGGDGIERLMGRRCPLDSDVLDKLIGSALYDGDPIRRELGFRTRRTLYDSLAEMVATTGR